MIFAGNKKDSPSKYEYIFNLGLKYKIFSFDPNLIKI